MVYMDSTTAEQCGSVTAASHCDLLLKPFAGACSQSQSCLSATDPLVRLKSSNFPFCFTMYVICIAGKSTVLRALAAAALCANVGLYIPAGPGSLVPHLDAIMLRTFSGDAPVEGLSGYAVEMQEMR